MCGADRHPGFEHRLVAGIRKAPFNDRSPHGQKLVPQPGASSPRRCSSSQVSKSVADEAYFLTPTIRELSQASRMVARLQRKSRSKSPAAPV
jgi:hypothetical protein